MEIWNNTVYTWKKVREKCFTEELKQYQKIKNLERRINILHWILLSIGFSLVLIPMIYLMYSVFILDQICYTVNIIQFTGISILFLNHFQLKHGIKKLDKMKMKYRMDSLHNNEVKERI